MIGFINAAAAEVSASKYYPTPVLGPVLYGALLGNMGSFFAKGFHGHLEKVQETILEALTALPDQDDSDSMTDNKKGVDFSSNNQKDSNQENAIEKARDAVLCELVNDDEMCPVLPMETKK